MEMAGRGFSGSYKYGYQGSEKDNEISGSGNSYTTEFRQLDPRLGRWFSVDPIFQPWQSPYTSMDNNPICLNDPLGNVVGGDGEKTIQTGGKTYTGRKLKKGESQEGKHIYMEGGTKYVLTPAEQKKSTTNANNTNLKNRTNYAGQEGKDYGYAEEGTAKSADNTSNDRLKGGGQTGQIKYYYNPDAIDKNGKKGTYFYQKPVLVNSQTNGPNRLAQTNPATNQNVAGNANFSFVAGAAAGLTPAMTAAIAAATPPQGPQPFAPTGGITSTQGPLQRGMNNENLPTSWSQTTNIQPGNIVTNVTTANMQMQTTWNAGDVGAAPVIANRQNQVQAQVVLQGIPAGSVVAWPTLYTGPGSLGGLPNRMNVNTNTRRTTMPVIQINNVINRSNWTFAEP